MLLYPASKQETRLEHAGEGYNHM